MMSSLLISTFCVKWWAFVFFWAVMFPAGAGFVYWVPILCAWEWFPSRKSLVSGIILAGYGFGAFLFGFVSTALVNPLNL